MKYGYGLCGGFHKYQKMVNVHCIPLFINDKISVASGIIGDVTMTYLGDLKVTEMKNNFGL